MMSAFVKLLFDLPKVPNSFVSSFRVASSIFYDSFDDFNGVRSFDLLFTPGSLMVPLRLDFYCKGELFSEFLNAEGWISMTFDYVNLEYWPTELIIVALL